MLESLTAAIHPRPQFTRDSWLDLGGQWGFAFDPENLGLSAGWMKRAEPFQLSITVPFPPESKASGIHDQGPHSVVWYRRAFKLSQLESQGRFVLHFGAVDYRASVWVNGELVVQHEGGHTPFEADITFALNEELAEQIIVVRAEDLAADLTQPRGKQYWEERPRSIWYHRTTGIWQPVWLESVPPIYISDIRWTPDATRGVLGLTITLNQQPDRPLNLGVRLSLKGVVLAQDTYSLETNELSREITLKNGTFKFRTENLLWSPEHPNLIDAEITLQANQTVLDRAESYAGLRSIAWSNGRFSLNGRPFYQRLILEQGYWPESHLAAPSAEAIRKEVELIKELGFNGVRIHQKVEDPRFLYWCDRLGLVVWGEMANAQSFSPVAVERLIKEWLEVLRRDYSHPSIVMWVPINESWGVPHLETDPAQQTYIQTLYYLTKTLDPTRPVIGNDGWEHIITDVLSIHDYALNGNDLRERYGTPEKLNHTILNMQPQHRTLIISPNKYKNEPVLLTEFGGISYAPIAGTPWHGYGTVTDAESFIQKYAELVDAVLECPNIFGYCYTQLTDTEQETNGLLNAQREPKFDLQALSEINHRPSKAVPGDVISTIHAAAEVNNSIESKLSKVDG